MPRLLKRQITNLITFREGTYTIVNALKMEITGDNKTEQPLPTEYQYMVNVLTGIEFFHSLGGRELLTYTVVPRTMDTIHLQVRLISPDEKQEIRYIFSLAFVSPDKLGEFINLR